jgi:hypothetical protein
MDSHAGPGWQRVLHRGEEFHRISAPPRIWRDGGAAHVAHLDVLDRTAVGQHADAVAAGGGIDICFNATSNDDVQGTPCSQCNSKISCTR